MCFVSAGCVGCGCVGGGTWVGCGVFTDCEIMLVLVVMGNCVFCFVCRGFESCDCSCRGFGGCEGWVSRLGVLIAKVGRVEVLVVVVKVVLYNYVNATRPVIGRCP